VEVLEPSPVSFCKGGEGAGKEGELCVGLRAGLEGGKGRLTSPWNQTKLEKRAGPTVKGCSIVL
jgi:hypothetical protein